LAVLLIVSIGQVAVRAQSLACQLRLRSPPPHRRTLRWRLHRHTRNSARCRRFARTSDRARSRQSRCV